MQPAAVPDPSTKRSAAAASRRCRRHQRQRDDRAETRRLACSRYTRPRVAVTCATQSCSIRRCTGNKGKCKGKRKGVRSFYSACNQQRFSTTEVAAVLHELTASRLIMRPSFARANERHERCETELPPIIRSTLSRVSVPAVHGIFW